VRTRERGPPSASAELLFTYNYKLQIHAERQMI
jgi:hypothetical protein